jgi:hypothetical protein
VKLDQGEILDAEAEEMLNEGIKEGVETPKFVKDSKHFRNDV